jgi:Protein of unknown function (DUF2889)
MPLSAPAARREIHHRLIEMRAYARDDGLYDVEAHLVDRKPFDFVRDSSTEPIPAGTALHDLWVRMTVDGDYTVRAIEAASDVTPWALCKQAEATLQVMVGERLVRGWSSIVKERLRGPASCTHLMEMLIPAATTALQGIRGLHAERRRAVDANGVPLKLDSCFAFAREREVVLQLWPQHHRPTKKEPS